MDSRVQEWRKSGAYLPDFLRDFHDQKDTFKTLHTTVDVGNHGYCGDVDWVKGQCYVVDIFLWHMARHGYVLRRTNKRLPFDDIEETNKQGMDRWRDAAARAMGLTPIDPPPQ